MMHRSGYLFRPFCGRLWRISYCFYLFTGVIRMHHLSEEIESLERRERITGVKRL